MVNPIPEHFTAVTPAIVVESSKKAIAWYKKVFGAKEIMCMESPDGKVMHAEISIDGAVIFVHDAMPEMGSFSPKSLKGSASSLYLYCKDVDATMAKAVEEGGTQQMAPIDMFWGDRMGSLVDPFGHKWAIATHTQDLTPEEIQKGQEEWMRSMAGASA